MVLGEVLEKTSLKDLMCGELEMSKRIEDMTGAMLPRCSPAGRAAVVSDTH